MSSRGGGGGAAPGAAGGGLGIILCAFVALLGSGAAIVWLTSAIAGLLAGSGPVTLNVDEATQILTQLPGNLGDPARAWPRALRADLPAAPVMIVALVLAAIIALGVLCALLYVVLRMQRMSEPTHGARWATSRQLRELRVNAPERGRVVLGREGRHLLAAEPRASVMVIAPAQSGKTTGLAIPAILEWDGPVLATSVKGDLVHDTLSARAQLGDVHVFDPTGSTGLATAAWSPVAASTSWEGARRTAARLLELRESRNASADETFWRPAAARYLAPLLYAASQKRLGMGDVLSWIATTNEDQPRELLEQMHSQGMPGAMPALEALQLVWEADARSRSSMMLTAATALDAWQEPAVAAATGGPGAIDATWLLSGSNTLYLSAPADDQKRLRGLFTALVADVVATAFAQSTRTGKPLDPPLLLCLDEAANVAPLPNLDELASTGPGQGVQLLSVFQNVSQIHDRWGRERAETIMANHRGRLFGSGIGDKATLEYVGAILGDQAVAKSSSHRQRLGMLELGSRTDTHEYRRLAAPNKLRQADRETALLVYGRLPPTWVKLRPWYRDRDLRRQVHTPQPQHPPTTSHTAREAA
jgi:type IV secretion system protein VirD4